MIQTLQSYFQSIKSQKEILLFDNKSLYFDFLQEILNYSGVRYSVINDFKKPSPPSYVIIYPFFEFRVFNFNYYRSLNKEFGKPYYVYIRNNRTQLIEAELSNTSFNLMTLVPELVAEYLKHPLFLDWIHQSSCLEPHNDSFDKKLMKQIILEINGQYKASTDLSGDPYKETISRVARDRITYEHLPLHRYYEKYLSMRLEINETERGLYGSVF